MRKKMLVNVVDEGEARVAIVEDGVLEELYMEATGKEQARGNIYKGVVVNVQQSIQAAFVDYGGRKAGFLPLSDVSPDCYSDKEAAERKGSRPNIKTILKRKQELLVQIVKEETASKGASLTTYLSIPGRYLVLMPGADSTMVSRKIEDEAERKKLKELFSELEPPAGMGFIIRTAGLHRTKGELNRDLTYLLMLWEQIKRRADELKAPALVYQEREIVTRFIRDYFSPDIVEVLIDDKDVYNAARDFFKELMPRYLSRVRLYQDKTPLFARFSIEDQIETIHQRKVKLKSGGSIVIEPTEAMVTIDVNSGKSVKEKGIEETAFATNMEAAEEIARQLRLRDLGGLIAVDFIDMKDNKHKQELERHLRNLLRKDKARVELSKISKFAILEISRQRIRLSFQNWHYNVCSACKGEGVVPSAEGVGIAILRKIKAEAVKNRLLGARVTAPLAVASYLLNRKRSALVKIESDFDIEVEVVGDPSLGCDQYNIEYTRSKSWPVPGALSGKATEEGPAQAEAKVEERQLTGNGGQQEKLADESIAQGEKTAEPSDRMRPSEDARRRRPRSTRQRFRRRKFVGARYQGPETKGPAGEPLSIAMSPEAGAANGAKAETMPGDAAPAGDKGLEKLNGSSS